MKKNFIVLITAILFNVSCKDNGADPDNNQSQYETFGLNSAKINNLITLIENKTFPKVHSLLIVKNDSLILEKYFNGYDKSMLHTLQSVTKSFTSAIIGISLERGFVTSIENKILDYFSNYTNLNEMNNWKREIKIKDILTMQTGVDYTEGYDGSPHSILNSLSTGWDLFYLNLPMSTSPGTNFNYDSGGVILLSALLHNACGMHADIIAGQYLFPQLGITDKRWIKNSEGHPHTGGGLYLTPRDMVKFGRLYLDKGMWNGQRVIPENWVNSSFEMKVNLGEMEPWVRGYGYLWWILKPGSKSRTSQNVYAAIGAMGQYIFVIPEYDMVVVVTSGGSTGEEFYQPQQFLYSHILDAVQ